MEKVKQLLDDYQRKLKTITEMAKHFKEDAAKDERIGASLKRYETKASCYRTFIIELERILKDGETT